MQAWHSRRAGDRVGAALSVAGVRAAAVALALCVSMSVGRGLPRSLWAAVSALGGAEPTVGLGRAKFAASQDSFSWALFAGAQSEKNVKSGVSNPQDGEAVEVGANMNFMIHLVWSG